MTISQFGWNLFVRYPRLFTVNMVLAVVLMVVDLATLASIAPVVSLLTQGAGQDPLSAAITKGFEALGLHGSVVLYLGVFVTLSVTNSLLLIVINYFVLRSQYVVRNDMVVGTAREILSSGVNYVNQQRQGDFINTLTLETQKVADAFTALTRLIAPVGQVTVLLWVPFYISWKMTLVAIATATVLLYPLTLFRKRTYALGQASTAANNEFSTALQESLQSIRLIISFAKEPGTLARLSASFRKLREASIKLQIVQSSVYAAHAPAGVIVVFITFLSGQYFGVSLAEIAVVLYAFNRLAGLVANINNGRNQLVSLYPSFEQVIRIRDGALAARLSFGDRPFSRLQREIRLDNVSFAFQPGANVVDQVSLVIPAGKMTALVGPSGSGKSTLADLVMGIQAPTQGQITVDGLPISSIDISAFRQSLGYVPQQASLFHASIRDNLLWANEQATEDDILAACRLANADRFIQKLPDGLDTVVGDRGVRLSGGQVQRIALARALIHNPSLLILDEATSALDSESETQIRAAIENVVGHTTILVIAHRLSTIARADNIVVLDHGRVSEQGTFKQLTDKRGTFARLVEFQQL